jgi:hypothetical protein
MPRREPRFSSLYLDNVPNKQETLCSRESLYQMQEDCTSLLISLLTCLVMQEIKKEGIIRNTWRREGKEKIVIRKLPGVRRLVGLISVVAVSRRLRC